MNNRKKRVLLAATGLLCAVSIASAQTFVYAAPSTKDLEKKTSDLKDDLHSMNSDLASLSKKHLVRLRRCPNRSRKPNLIWPLRS